MISAAPLAGLASPRSLFSVGLARKDARPLMAVSHPTRIRVTIARMEWTTAAVEAEIRRRMQVLDEQLRRELRVREVRLKRGTGYDVVLPIVRVVATGGGVIVEVGE